MFFVQFVHRKDTLDFSRKSVVASSFAVITSIFLTLPSSLGNTLVTKAYFPLGDFVARRKAKTSIRQHDWLKLAGEKIRLTSSKGRNSLVHPAQKTFARYCTCLHWAACRSLGLKTPGGGGFCVRIIDGLSIWGASGSVGTGARGRLFIIAETSAIKVMRPNFLG